MVEEGSVEETVKNAEVIKCAPCKYVEVVCNLEENEGEHSTLDEIEARIVVSDYRPEEVLMVPDMSINEVVPRSQLPMDPLASLSSQDGEVDEAAPSPKTADQIETLHEADSALDVISLGLPEEGGNEAEDEDTGVDSRAEDHEVEVERGQGKGHLHGRR